MNDRITAFWGGFGFSVTGNIQWIWLQVFPMDANTAAAASMVFAIKVISTLILGVIGGVAGMVGKDVYDHLKQKFKR